MSRSRCRLAALERGVCLISAVAMLIVADVPTRGVGIVPRAAAQVMRRPAGSEGVSQSSFFVPDRQILRKLSQSRKLIEEGRFGEAVRFLGAILEEPEDYFYRPDESTPIYHSLKSEAERLIGQMPRKGRDLYELQYGAEARRTLSDALESGDVSRLAEVSRRFFHTRSGYQATFLLGLHHFDHGRPLAGAMVLQRLYDGSASVEELEPALSLTIAACWLQTGMTEKAREALVAMRHRDPAVRVMVAGREVPLFADDSEAIDWLTGLIGTWSVPKMELPDNWLMFRGDHTRTASTAGGAPLLNLRWRVPACNDPLTESVLEQSRNMFSERKWPTIPMLHPLAVGDVLLVRTLQNLWAVDFATGKRLWKVPLEDPAESSFPGNPQTQQLMLTVSAGQRMWGDLTYGTLSSDGRNVYSVEDLGIEFGDDAVAVRRMIIMNRIVARNVRTNLDSLSNRLAAHDIRTGKLVWELGGPDGPDALPQADTFFLGPPLPLQGRLYVLAETRGEVCLLALNAAAGNFLWSQQLSMAERSVLEDQGRRWEGISPSYADGVLVCPTSTGAVVGIELATRSLLWGYPYNQVQYINPYNRGWLFPGGPSIDRWIDGGVSICDGRVLITPLDSNEIHCLDLIKGELLWKSPRNNDLYVACVDKEKVVLVGSDAVHALRMSDGKPAWDGRAVALPEGSMPSGRGFLSGDHYYLPLSSAEVAAIDLGAGKIARLTKSHDGTVPGNLICHRGKIISQGLEGVDTYFQLDVASAEVQRRLKANPNDAGALSLQGEILLDAGKRSEAVAAFRRAYELVPNPGTRDLLRNTLFEGLRGEFAAYRGRDAEIEPLLDDPSQRATYLRLMASGLRGEGQWAEAFEHYLKLVDLEPGRQPLDEVEKGLVVRRDRWIQGQLSELRRDAKGDAAAKIDRLVSARLKKATAGDSIVPLQRFLDFFGGLPVAGSARDELLRRLKSKGRLIEAELASPAAEEPAAGVDSKRDVVWPTGNVEISTDPTKNLAALNNRHFPVELRGSPGPFFRGLSIKYDYTRREIVAFDGLGSEKWKVSVAEDIKQQNFPFQYVHARAVGHLLLVSLGWKIFAIDTLGTGPDAVPQLLWVKDLYDASLAGLPPQFQQQFVNHQDQSNLLQLVNSRYVCLQRFHNIMAVDPRTGETLWVRQNFSANCDLFGDEQHLFVISTDKEDATLLRVMDGESLGARKVPRQSTRQRLPNGEFQTTYLPLQSTYLGAFGRKLLLWWPSGNQRELTMIDPYEGRDDWPRRKFHCNSRTCVLDDEVVGVLEPDGHFTLVSLPDGRTLADVKLQEEPNLINVTLFKSGEQYFLLTNSPLGSGNMLSISPMPNQMIRSYSPIYRGRLYSFDRQGKLLWPKPVKVQKQLLLTDQLDAMPVVIFACQQYEQKANGQLRFRPKVLCVDKRSGRTVYKGEYDNHVGRFHVACDVEKKTVVITVYNKAITLTYTDKPIPPPSADKDPAKSSPGSKIGRALWNSFRESLGPDFDPFEDD